MGLTAAGEVLLLARVDDPEPRQRDDPDSKSDVGASVGMPYPGTLASMLVITMSGTLAGNAQNVTSTSTTDLSR